MAVVDKPAKGGLHHKRASFISLPWLSMVIRSYNDMGIKPYVIPEMAQIPMGTTLRRDLQMGSKAFVP